MFLKVFFRFLSNFGDNSARNPRKFRSYLGEIKRKIKNFGEVVRYFSIILKKCLKNCEKNWRRGTLKYLGRIFKNDDIHIFGEFSVKFEIATLKFNQTNAEYTWDPVLGGN